MLKKNIRLSVVLVALVCALPIGLAGSQSAGVGAAIATLPTTFTRVGCILDKSISMRSAGIAPASPNDFAPVIRIIEKRGGEIGIGLVDEDINHGLLRLEVSPPPQRPDEAGNPLGRALKDLPAYRASLSQWQSETAQRVAAFRTTLAARLAEKSTARFSAINLQLRRVQVFLNEPVARGISVKPVLVVVSDGLDTTTIHRVTLTEGTRVLVVGSPARPEAFSYLKPLQFESLSAALRNIE